MEREPAASKARPSQVGSGAPSGNSRMLFRRKPPGASRERRGRGRPARSPKPSCHPPKDANFKILLFSLSFFLAHFFKPRLFSWQDADSRRPLILGAPVSLRSLTSAIKASNDPIADPTCGKAHDIFAQLIRMLPTFRKFG